MNRLLLLALLLTPALARADTLYWLGAKLPNDAHTPWAYSVDETQSSPGGLPVAHIEQETRDAYQRWEDVSCAYITFKFDGAITDPAQLGNHADTKSVMSSFVTTRDDPRYSDDLGNGVAVGVALTLKQNGVILGCDTEFNSADWVFNDDGDGSSMDFPSLANHENGHCLGLDHDPNDTTSVMYPTSSYGDLRRTLDAHDIDNVCQLYPESGSLGSPCSGASCTGQADLKCITNPTGGGQLCSHACDPAAPASCAAGFGCRADTTDFPGSTGACFPGAGDNSSKIGAACTAPADCNGALAVCFDTDLNHFPDGYCSQACDSSVCPTGNVCVAFDAHSYCMAPCTSTGGGCRPGYACNAYDSAGNGFCYPACTSSASCAAGASCLCTGVCVQPGNGQAYVGSRCNTAFDCATGQFCIPSSIDGAATGWPQGYCASPCGGGNSCLACPSGSACAVSGAEGQAYCLQSCDSHGGCRAGYTCTVEPGGTPGAAVQVCMPGSGCASDADCAVGRHCRGGACVDPNADDGGQSCVLCGDGGQLGTTGSAGTSGTPPPPATPSGCGCGAVDAGSLLGMAWVMLGALARRRRRW